MRQTDLLVALLIIGSAFTTAGNTATVVSGTTAVTSSDFPDGVGLHVAERLVDPTELNASNEHLTGNFLVGDGSWLSADTIPNNQWAYVDLERELDVVEVRIWNYHEFFGLQDTSGRGVAQYEMFVAGAGATLPSGEVMAPFTGAGGWSTVGSGTLAKGPDTTTTENVPLPATDTFPLSTTDVRFVGIDIISLHGPVPFTDGAVGLAQIQVVAVPEPVNFVLFELIGLFCVGWGRNRRLSTSTSM